MSKWIRHRYTCVPHPEPSSLFPPPSPYHPSGSSQCTSPKHPVSCNEPGLATRFLHDILHVSMDCFFKRVDRIESSKEPDTVPSMQAWVTLQLTLCLLLLLTFQLYYLPLRLPPLVSNPCLFTGCQLLYCTTALFKVLCYRLKMFPFFFACLHFMYY